GITLTGALLPDAPISDGVLPVRLAWTFDAPVTPQTIRFIKALDADGNPVTGLDTAPGAFQAGDALAERLDLDVTGISGALTVYVGWYTLPDAVRLPVLTEGVRGAADGWALLGTVEVGIP
ncbi:MAG: hypothetical protein H7Y11_10360, partial [Armatimonadetes bacterium]|nr:hypothetical protein [Anaerolineae bacterium]